MVDQAAPAGESTATATPTRPCRFCQIPVPQPKRRGQVKDFCSDRHRAAFRDAQVQAGIREAQAAIQETRDEISRLDARLSAATQLLERGLRHGRRTPRAERQPVQPSAELAKAFTSLGIEAAEKK